MKIIEHQNIDDISILEINRKTTKQLKQTSYK